MIISKYYNKLANERYIDNHLIISKYYNPSNLLAHAQLV